MFENLSFGEFIGKVEIDGNLVAQWVCEAYATVQDSEGLEALVSGMVTLCPFLADGSVISLYSVLDGIAFKFTVDRSVEGGCVLTDPLTISENGNHDVRNVNFVTVNVGGELVAPVVDGGSTTPISN
ncbi:MAG: hypothetical protein IKE23_00870 [Exiguobacterium sp.]|nr:hypothetical protein [Exiguobacterium sp.]